MKCSSFSIPKTINPVIYIGRNIPLAVYISVVQLRLGLNNAVALLSTGWGVEFFVRVYAISVDLNKKW
jgi:hypothetical protein